MDDKDKGLFFLQLSKALARDPSVKAYFITYLDFLSEYMSFDRGCIIISEDDWRRTFKEYMNFGVTLGTDSSLKGSLDNTYLHVIAKTGKPKIHKRLIGTPFFDLRYFNSQGFNSCLQAPLIYDNSLIGVLLLCGMGENQFKDVDMELLYESLPFLAGSLRQTIIQEQLEEANKKLTRSSITDQTTRAYNYLFFLKRIKEEFYRVKRYKGAFSCMVINIDRFREINDKYGHLFGDFVLRRFTMILKKNLRKVDIIARYGGDEFIVLMPNTDKEKAELVGEKIRTAAGGHDFIRGKKSARVNITLGVSSYPADGVEDVIGVIKRADREVANKKANIGD